MGRSPWTAADAPVGARRPSPCGAVPLDSAAVPALHGARGGISCQASRRESRAPASRRRLPAIPRLNPYAWLGPMGRPAHPRRTHFSRFPSGDAPCPPLFSFLPACCEIHPRPADRPIPYPGLGRFSMRHRSNSIANSRRLAASLTNRAHSPVFLTHREVSCPKTPARESQLPPNPKFAEHAPPRTKIPGCVKSALLAALSCLVFWNGPARSPTAFWSIG